MDEPFGALDPVTRVELQREFARIQQKLTTTVILVTHDMAEAFALGHRIGVVDSGALVVCDAPAAVARSRDPRVRVLLETLNTPPGAGAAP
jgi:osmoprotectant transport system ATP-binding protein